MTSSNTPPNFYRLVPALTAVIFLAAAAQGALAKNGGNTNDHNKMGSTSSDLKSY